MNTKIGFFDSGIGGITVLNKCIKLNSNFEYIYYSDSINNPYGDKTEEELRIINDKIVKYLISKGCKIIVIACNTASAISAEFLRNKYQDIHFIAIEPAIKLTYKKQGNTLIMATEGTIKSKRFNSLLKKYQSTNTYILPCKGLANMIENNSQKEIETYLNDNLNNYKGKITNVVLGCTHYPLIKKEIENILGNVNIYDGSLGVAKQLKRIINQNNFISNNKFNIVFIDSSNDKNKKERFYNLLNKPFKNDKNKYS